MQSRINQYCLILTQYSMRGVYENDAHIQLDKSWCKNN